MSEHTSTASAPDGDGESELETDDSPVPPLTPKDTYPPCSGPATDGAMAAAKGAFHAGTAAFNEADYERVIVYWEDAFRRDCSAVAMLKNLARAYELNEQYRQAIDALTTYAARVEGSAEDGALARRVANLRRKLGEEKQRRVAAKKARRLAAARKASPTPRPTPTQGEAWDEELEEPTDSRSLVPLIFAGAGLGAVVLGAVKWHAASSDLTRVEDLCGGRACSDPALRTEGNDARNRVAIWGLGVTGGGALLLTGGLIWYFVQDTEPAEEPFALDVGPGFAGARFNLSFQ